jgi:hypothetical protein
MKKAITFASLARACTPAQAAGGNTWKYELLHSFNPAVDGPAPTAGLTELLNAKDGAIYGTATAGGATTVTRPSAFAV